MSSEQRIIFLGENVISSLNKSSINWKYVWKNLHYGWIGSIAMIYVSEGAYTKTEMEEFKQLLKEQNVKSKKLPEGSSSDDMGYSILGAIALIVLPIWIKIPLSFWSASEVIGESKNLRSAQYSYLINEFLLNGINNYLKE
jgi:hypothetical protein